MLRKHGSKRYSYTYYSYFVSLNYSRDRLTYSGEEISTSYSMMETDGKEKDLELAEVRRLLWENSLV